jgi:hypothetical protein
MNLNQLLSIMDPDKLDQDQLMAGRRGFFKTASNLGMKAAVASLPAIFSFIPKAVQAQTASVVDVLNFALTLEYLEDEFYKKGLSSSGLIPEEYHDIFMQIGKHESAHVNFLKTALGSSAVEKPEFDFTAGGAFPDGFTNFKTFVTLSQAFEDTGVRAYKGQAGNLAEDKKTLQAALQIHSVEARHASEVRRVRCEVVAHGIKGWITGKESNGAPQAVYEGEENILHATISLDSISSLSSVSAMGKTEAFDEPLTMEQVLAIVKPFIKA